MFAACRRKVCLPFTTLALVVNTYRTLWTALLTPCFYRTARLRHQSNSLLSIFILPYSQDLLQIFSVHSSNLIPSVWSRFRNQSLVLGVFDRTHALNGKIWPTKLMLSTGLFPQPARIAATLFGTSSLLCNAHYTWPLVSY